MSNDRSRNTFRTAPASKPLNRQPNLWPPVAALAIFAYGLYRAIDLKWICDDAFITMRYVKNFVEGNGLVYNIGERVEGYTHFLWLMLLAASKAIGFDPVDASMWLGIAAYAGILVLLLAISLREHKKDPKRIWLPIAAALFALNYDTAEWASGGLETSFYTLLILGAFYLWFYSRFSEQRRLLVTGLMLALVSLTRPDGVLFTAIAAVLLGVLGYRRKQQLSAISRSIATLMWPSLAIGVPYLIWKYFYYGDPLPLTYYAKSADANYFGQGLFYIWLYFRVYFISGIAVVAGLYIVLRKNPQEDAVRRSSDPGSPSLAATVIIVGYLLLFVARVGGDFMFARFIIPVVPFVYFIVEGALNHLPAKMLNYRIGIALLLVASTIVENKLREGVLFHLNDKGKPVENWNLPEGMSGSTRGIAEERWVYYSDHFLIGGVHRGSMDVCSEIGKTLEPYFRGLPVTVAIPGAENMIAYYANFAVVLNEFGLTDSTIAHSALLKRARIGHEKLATEAYFVKRHVNVEMQNPIGTLPDQLPVNSCAFEMPQLGIWQTARLVTYDQPLMDTLAARFRAADNKSILPLYEQLIPYYADHLLSGRPLNLLEADYAAFEQLYFSRYPEPALQQRFVARIAELKRDSAAGK